MRKEEKREKRTKRKEKTRLTVFGTKLDCQRWLIGSTARQTLSKTLRLPYLPVTVTQSGGSSGPQVRGILALALDWLTSRPATFPAGPIRAPGHRGTSLGSRISFLIGCPYFVAGQGRVSFFFWTINSSRRPDRSGLLVTQKSKGPWTVDQSIEKRFYLCCRTPYSTLCQHSVFFLMPVCCF